MAIIRRTEEARNGDIVVALVKGEEVTLKTLMKKGAKVDLVPENKEHKVQTYDADQVQIQGVLSSIIRMY